jgi:hypothetical protein
MPWQVARDGSEDKPWCVHEENEDGSMGARVPGGCHATEEQARNHQKALYVNVKEEVAAKKDGDEVNCEDCEDEDEDEDEITMQQALVFASLPEPEFVDVDGENTTDVIAGRKYARAVRFTNLAVAKAERNANGDLISVQNLGELAATINGMPGADRHPGKATPHVIGFFVGGRVVTVRNETNPAESGEYLLTDGMWWSGRHPKIVSELVMGARKPSIEAVSDRTGCSVCNTWFDSPAQYCGHLLAFRSGVRAADNVARMHENMKMTGVAMVHDPAGSNTGFHNGRFYMVAETLPDGEVVDIEAEATQVQDSIQEDAMNAEQEKELRDRIADLEALVADATAKLEAQVAKYDALLEENSTVIARVAQLVSSGMTVDDIKELPVAKWDEKTFGLIAERAKPVKQSTSGTIVADSKSGNIIAVDPYAVMSQITVKA